MAVEVELEGLDGLAAALTGSPEAAARLVGATLADRRAGRVRDEAELRRLLVQQFLRMPPPEPRVIENELPAELGEVAARLGALRPPDRAGLVLVLLTGLTLTETAGLLDTTPTALKRRLDPAEATLGGDRTAVSATLHALSWRVPEPAAVAAARFRAGQAASRRRGRIRMLVVALGLVLLAAVAVPTVRILQPLPTRAPGAWVFGLQLDPPPGWKTAWHAVGVDQEYLEIFSDAGQCTVIASLPSVPADRRVEPQAESERAWVNGRPARYSESQVQGPRVQWSYGRGGEVTLTCRGMRDRRVGVLAIAERIRFSVGEPVVLPVALARLPDGFQVGGTGYDGPTPVFLLSSGPNLSASGAQIFVEVSAGSAVPVGRAVTTGGVGWTVRVREGEARACRLVQSVRICVGSGIGEISDGAAERATDRALAVARDLRLAADLKDRSTWFDAREALPQ